MSTKAEQRVGIVDDDVLEKEGARYLERREARERAHARKVRAISRHRAHVRQHFPRATHVKKRMIWHLRAAEMDARVGAWNMEKQEM